jgi:hypothetical protein
LYPVWRHDLWIDGAGRAEVSSGFRGEFTQPGIETIHTRQHRTSAALSDLDDEIVIAADLKAASDRP